MPVDDYINHLAEAYVLALHVRDPILNQFYASEWTLTPNLAMDLTVPFLVPITGIYVAGKLFVAAYVALTVTGVAAVYYALRRRMSPAPLVAALFVYNGAANVGLLNYVFGIGLALWAFAAWIAMKPAHPILRAAVSLAFIVAIFLCHLEAIGLYGLAVLSFEAYHLPKAQNKLAAAAAAVAPFLVVPALMALNPAQHGPALLQWGSVGKKVIGLSWIFVSQSYWRPPDVAVAALIPLIVVWALWRGLLRIHPIGIVFAAISGVIYLVLPYSVLSATNVDVRLPIGIVFFLIAFLEWRLEARILVPGLAILLLARIGIVDYAWTRTAAITDEVEKSLDLIPRGSKVLVAQADAPPKSLISPVEYSPCQAIIERSSLVSVVFSDPRQQMLRVREPYRAITGGYDDEPPPVHEILSPPAWSSSSPSGRIYWRHWSDDYDYLYVLSSMPGDANPASDKLTKVYEGRRFQLYQIIRKVG